jgi:cytochrome oxidase assembly protein ShyY1
VQILKNSAKLITKTEQEFDDEVVEIQSKRPVEAQNADKALRRVDLRGVTSEKEIQEM